MPNNLLTPNQASIETNTTGWFAGTNCTISRTTSWSAHGSASLALTSTAAGNVSAVIPSGLNGTPVSANTLYTGQATVRSATVARIAKIGMEWYNAAGTNIGSSLIGPNVSTSTTSNNILEISGVSPDLTAFCRIYVQFNATAAAGEIHYLDQAGIWEGPGGSWSMPGQSGWTAADFERASLLATASGALPTDTISDLRLKRFKTATVGLATVADYEADFIEAAINNEAPSDSLYDLRRKYWGNRGGLSGVGLTTDDMAFATLTAGK